MAASRVNTMLTATAIKLTGLCLLSSGITVFGITKSSGFTAVIRKRKAVEALLRAIEDGIKYGSHGKQRIYKGFQNSELEKCGFLTALKNGNDEKSCVTAFLSDLDKEDKDSLCSFFDCLGRNSSAEREAKQCKAFTEEFIRNGIDKEKTLLSKAVLYKKLGLICAVMSVIIFI